MLDQYKEEYNLKTFETYYQKLAQANRFDCAEVIFIKRLLQVELQIEVKKLITDILFRKIVGIEETVFARELYMNTEQLQCMAEAGMHIGSHGFDHFWLSSLSCEQQRFEIEKSIEFIKMIYAENFDRWTICYPYGAYNDDTLSLLQECGCAAAFTTKVDIAKIVSGDNFTLPRLDTNDMPKDRNADTNSWYELA